MVGRLLSYWEGILSGAMLNFQEVNTLLCQGALLNISVSVVPCRTCQLALFVFRWRVDRWIPMDGSTKKMKLM